MKRWAARLGLAADQSLAAETTLSTRDWLSALEGRAGAAKTTTVNAIREMAERGYLVRGFGPTSGSVKALTEAGVLARTVASLLEDPKLETRGREVWIVDESSLLATRQVNRLLHLAKHIGVERVVFVGDERQHHAIEAGRPLYQMRQAGMTTASLTVIRRQRDPELRKAVELAAAGKLAETIAALSEQQRIREIAEPPERYRAIAEDYLRSHRGGRTTLVVSPAIEERSELNRVIRDLLVDRGEVARAGLELPTSTNLDLTRAQRAHARHYAVGDVIHFRRGSAKLEIAPGTYATVEASDERRNVLRLRAESGTIVEYRPGRFRGVEVFHAESRTIAIGDRIPLVRAHPSQTASQSRQSHHRDFSRSDRARPKPRLRLRSDRGGRLPGERLHVEHHPSGNSHDPHTFAGRPIRVVR